MATKQVVVMISVLVFVLVLSAQEELGEAKTLVECIGLCHQQKAEQGDTASTETEGSSNYDYGGCLGGCLGNGDPKLCLHNLQKQAGVDDQGQGHILADEIQRCLVSCVVGPTNKTSGSCKTHCVDKAYKSPPPPAPDCVNLAV
ncbi:OLC1v1020892C1 [Oldenlandia corymbosa var. corymbosa]|uniref:OLC1v1020892C1 n=1 Tax=Oldenlandia corymbosa var. corymbosa TaxID=529605 RepID=A0AAV1BUG0_OLDCO|nr:OLC1v1020892C1 [Oldenlandia corymbosa var. corymbosa]